MAVHQLEHLYNILRTWAGAEAHVPRSYANTPRRAPQSCLQQSACPCAMTAPNTCRAGCRFVMPQWSDVCVYRHIKASSTYISV